VPRIPVVDWSPADGDFVHHCPTYAIRTEPESSQGTENQQESSEAKTLQEKEERLETA
jgi:hypothetical protein